MRVENFNPNKYDASFEDVTIDRLVDAAELLAAAVRRRCHVGTVSRPMYRSGPYAGLPWTARDAGQLKRSVRVTRLKTKSGKAFSKKRNVRVYVGNKMAYYASIVENSKPFMRPAYYASFGAMKSVIGAE